MSSLVSDFIINPVLRQARRFSSGFAAEEAGAATGEALPRASSIASRGPVRDNAISESEEDVLTSAAPLPVTDASAGIPFRTSAVSGDPPGPSVHGWHEERGSENHAQDSSSRSSRLATESSDEGLSDSGASNAAAPWNGKQRSVLPEDDGMGILRKRILVVQSRDIPAEQKALLMHQLLMEGYTKSQLTSQAKRALRPESPSSQTLLAERSVLPGALQTLWNSLSDNSGPLDLPLTEEDLRPTYAPPPQDDFVERIDGLGAGQKRLGCEHYQRNVKLQCVVCERWYTCRLCHDDAESHILPRYATRNMLCMLCGCAQRVGDTCVGCGESAAHYYCSICRLWNDNPNKPIYHCNDCGICRIGQGIGKDFFHCSKCAACIPISMEGGQHKCIERAIDSNCPICGEHMFSSRTKVIFMNCGHAIHRPCWDEHMKTSYKCPICNKSCVNMETQFRNLDIMILNQPMPAEYRDTRAIISCNDCSAKSQTAYHWLGLKCTICQSYNTVQLQLLDLPNNDPDRAPQNAGEGVTAETAGLQVFAAPEALAARDIPWPRNPSAHRAGGSIGSREDIATFSPFLVPERRAQSVSPLPATGFLDFELPTDDSDVEEDMLDFWGRDEGKNITSAESAHADSERESDGSAEDCDEDEDDDDEDDDDDDDPIALLGHR